MRPNNIKEKLIKIFAAHSVPDIEANNGACLKETLGEADYSLLLENDDYKEYFITLKELRDNLDDIVQDTQKQNLEQVKECLRLLKDTKDNMPGEKFELLSQLIKKGLYAKTWTKNQKEYYNKGREMLAVWKDFFFSYTNRNLVETNNDFKEILCDIFGKTDFQENCEKTNCAARLIVHYLYLNNLTAFFDQDNMTCGDVIKDEIFKHCTSVFSFVQLVEPVSFHLDHQDNWPYREFQTFDEWITHNGLDGHKQYYFILTQENVFPANFPGIYQDWKTKIMERVHVPDLSSLNKKQIRDKVWEIAGEIVKAKNRILSDYFN